MLSIDKSAINLYLPTIKHQTIGMYRVVWKAVKNELCHGGVHFLILEFSLLHSIL